MESGPLARSETEEKGRNGELCQEPVVHFKEWTTGWAGNWSNGQKSVICHELVDHWLTLYRGYCLVSTFFQVASGPLARSETKKRAEIRELC